MKTRNTTNSAAISFNGPKRNAQDIKPEGVCAAVNKRHASTRTRWPETKIKSEWLRYTLFTKMRCRGQEIQQTFHNFLRLKKQIGR